MTIFGYHNVREALFAELATIRDQAMDRGLGDLVPLITERMLQLVPIPWWMDVDREFGADGGYTWTCRPCHARQTDPPCDPVTAGVLARAHAHATQCPTAMAGVFHRFPDGVHRPATVADVLRDNAADHVRAVFPELG